MRLAARLALHRAGERRRAVHVAAGGARQVAESRGAQGRVHVWVQGLAGGFGDRVGLVRVLFGRGPGGVGLCAEFGNRLVADLLAELVLLGDYVSGRVVFPGERPNMDLRELSDLHPRSSMAVLAAHESEIRPGCRRNRGWLTC